VFNQLVGKRTHQAFQGSQMEQSCGSEDEKDLTMKKRMRSDESSLLQLADN